MNNRPTLIDLGTVLCNTTFSGGNLTITNSNGVIESLSDLQFIAYWRYGNENGDLVMEKSLIVGGIDIVEIEPFKLFTVSGTYFLNIFSKSSQGDLFEIYRAKITLSNSKTS
ncbi:MAG: hypothetical protein ACK4UP_05560 [Spirosomataceae bacterium]